MSTASFTVDELRKLREQAGTAWLEFFDVASLSMGIYHVASGTDDRATHQPHARDEVYVGVSGNGQLTADGERYRIEPGSVVYVKAGVEHHFHDVIDDLTVLVLFAGDAGVDV